MFEIMSSLFAGKGAYYLASFYWLLLANCRQKREGEKNNNKSPFGRCCCAQRKYMHKRMIFQTTTDDTNI